MGGIMKNLVQKREKGKNPIKNCTKICKCQIFYVSLQAI